jgi:hypothetical protein
MVKDTSTVNGPTEFKKLKTGAVFNVVGTLMLAGGIGCAIGGAVKKESTLIYPAAGFAVVGLGFNLAGMLHIANSAERLSRQQ